VLRAGFATPLPGHPASSGWEGPARRDEKRGISHQALVDVEARARLSSVHNGADAHRQILRRARILGKHLRLECGRLPEPLHTQPQHGVRGLRRESREVFRSVAGLPCDRPRRGRPLPAAMLADVGPVWATIGPRIRVGAYSPGSEKPVHAGLFHDRGAEIRTRDL
jgi:hypothetical protein